MEPGLFASFKKRQKSIPERPIFVSPGGGGYSNLTQLNTHFSNLSCSPRIICFQFNIKQVLHYEVYKSRSVYLSMAIHYKAFLKRKEKIAIYMFLLRPCPAMHCTFNRAYITQYMCLSISMMPMQHFIICLVEITLDFTLTSIQFGPLDFQV